MMVMKDPALSGDGLFNLRSCVPFQLSRAFTSWSVYIYIYIRCYIYTCIYVFTCLGKCRYVVAVIFNLSVFLIFVFCVFKFVYVYLYHEQVGKAFLGRGAQPQVCVAT